jgi:hypothetical protein
LISPLTSTRNLSGHSIEIPNTRSPDGKFALFSVYLDGTTFAVAAIVTTDRKRCLAVASSFPYGSNVRDRKPKSYLTVLWSTNSTYVAIHDSARRHSLLEVFACSESGGQQVELPNLFKMMSTKDFIPANPRSSGQKPIEWIENKRLVVEVRAETRLGKKRRSPRRATLLWDQMIFFEASLITRRFSLCSL